MSGFAWKLSLAVLIALLLAASTLALRARTHDASPGSPSPPVHGAADRLIGTERAAVDAADRITLRAAMRTFAPREGRLVAKLSAWIDLGDLASVRPATPWLTRGTTTTGAVTRARD